MNTHNNIFTVDLEDSIYTYNFNIKTSTDLIDRIKENIINNAKALLRILKYSHSKATFFVLGKLAEDLPELIRDIYDAGHEIASHGYEHKSLFDMNPDSLRRDLDRTSLAIFNACGNKPIGFRAPNFSLSENMHWAIDILKEEGYSYDSSIQPFGYHPQYGSSTSSTRVFTYENGLIEIPMTVAKFSIFRIPCSGGAYFRFFPYSIFNHLFRKSIIQNEYSMFYFHQWELSSSQKFDTKNTISRFRKYYNSDKSIGRLEKLTSEFNFVSAKEYLEKMKKEYVY